MDITNDFPTMSGSTEWMADAACRGVDTTVFFPDDPRISGRYAEARLVCAACPVRTACLDWAILNRLPAGLWGGLTPSERHDESSRRGYPRVCDRCGSVFATPPRTKRLCSPECLRAHTTARKVAWNRSSSNARND